MTTKLVSWPTPPALCGPVDETGEPVVESESDGECLTSRGPPAPLPVALQLGCDADDRLAMEDARRGLLAEVIARERLPPWNGAVAWPEVGGEIRELFEEVDECLLVT